MTVTRLRRMKAQGARISMLTAYDYTMALLLDRAGVDVLLVGDSLGMVMLGYENTLPVTMDDMIHHTRAVTRAAKRALIVADMPFMSYQASVCEAVTNAGRLLKEARAEAVKLEGGREILEQVRAMSRAGIPVMGHLGLRPQTVHQMGGYRVQGRSEEAARGILEEAAELEAAGIFCLILECVPHNLAGQIAARLHVPVVGIGAGPGCDGQVLVTQDMLGLYEEISPRHVKRFANLNATVREAVTAYMDEVRNATFPGMEHSFSMDEAVAERLDTEWAATPESHPV